MFKPYPNRKDTPQRMARKRRRNNVFQHNRKAVKVQRKAARLARLESREG